MEKSATTTNMGGVDTSTQKKRQQTIKGTMRSIEREEEKEKGDMEGIVDLSMMAKGTEMQRKRMPKTMQVNQMQRKKWNQTIF